MLKFALKTEMYRNLFLPGNLHTFNQPVNQGCRQLAIFLDMLCILGQHFILLQLRGDNRKPCFQLLDFLADFLDFGFVLLLEGKILIL